ncbi:hypothetical protein DFJ73DRAFT_933370, partial [Zopfochytrium polystomum]
NWPINTSGWRQIATGWSDLNRPLPVVPPSSASARHAATRAQPRCPDRLLVPPLWKRGPRPPVHLHRRQPQKGQAAARPTYPLLQRPARHRRRQRARRAPLQRGRRRRLGPARAASLVVQRRSRRPLLAGLVAAAGARRRRRQQPRPASARPAHSPVAPADPGGPVNPAAADPAAAQTPAAVTPMQFEPSRMFNTTRQDDVDEAAVLQLALGVEPSPELVGRDPHFYDEENE